MDYEIVDGGYLFRHEYSDGSIRESLLHAQDGVDADDLIEAYIAKTEALINLS